MYPYLFRRKHRLHSSTTHTKSIDVSIGKHHRRVVLIQGVSTDGADESRVGAVCVGQRMSKVVQMSTAHWAVTVALNRVFLVTVTGATVKVILETHAHTQRVH